MRVKLKLYQWMIRNYRLLLIVLILMSIAFVFGTSKLKVNSSMEEMLSADNPVIKASESFEESFDTQEQGIIIIKGTKEIAENWMKDMEALLLNKPSVSKILYKIDYTELGNKAMLFLDEQWYEEIEALLNKQNVKGILNKLIDMKEKNSNESNEVKYISNESNDAFLMVIKPELDSENFVESRKAFYDTVNDAINQLNEKYKDYDVEAGLTGGAFINDIEADTVAMDGMTGTMIITIIAILIFVGISLKRILIPVMSGVLLAIGTLGAASAAYLVYGSLNMFSVSFALLLLGLGIDFAVHIIVRFSEERLRGEAKNTSLLNAMLHTGDSIIAGAITTSIAFMSFVFADFGAFKQMGVISGMGVIILCICMLVFLPSIIMLIKEKNTSTIRTSSYTFLAKTTQHTINHKWSYIIIILILTAIFIPFTLKTKIVGDIDKIFPENMPSKHWEQELKDSFEYNPNMLQTVVLNKSDLQKAVISLESREDVEEVVTIESFMPDKQGYKLEVLEKLSSLLYGSGIKLDEEFPTREISYEELPESVRSNYIGKDGKLLIEITPKSNINEQASYQKLAEAVFDATGQLPVGMASIMNEVTLIVQKDIIKVSIICLLFVLLMLVLVFRRIRDVFIGILPLLLTIIFTLGLLRILKVDINIFSIAAFPILIGIGIDSSIHLLHRLRKEQAISVEQSVMETGKAIVITSVTTILGFGSLGFINHPGMANLGITVALGMGINLVLTLILIPLGFSMISRRK